jgi:ABC-type transport system substrate-binding protein
MTRTAPRPLLLAPAVAALIAVLVALLTVGCGGSPQPASTASGSSASPAPGGTAVIPLSAEPHSILPHDIQDSESLQVAHQLFEGLVKYELGADGTMRTEPCIAESWSSSPELKVWTFKLRHGVMFQAPVSTEVTAADFVACFEYVTDPANGSFTTYVLAPIQGVDDNGYAQHGITGVKAVDRYTLRFTLRYPFAEFPELLGTPVSSVWPVGYLRKVGKRAFAEKPVGTGPFVLQTWKQGQYVDLARNDAWWGAASGGPYLDGVHMPILLDTQTMWLDFQKGDLDFTRVPTGQAQTSSELPQVKDGEWTAKVWPQLAVDYVGINVRDARLGGAGNLPLRQALSYALDRAAIVRLLSQSSATVAEGLVPPGVPGSGTVVTPYGYDPAKAKALVAGLGTLDTLSYWYNTNEFLEKLGEAYQAAWEAVGIPVELGNFEFGTYAEKVYTKGEAQLFYLAWQADYPSMDSFLYPMFQSGRSAWGSGTGYSNPEVDRLLGEARRTADEPARIELYREAERLILQDAPVIPVESGGGYHITNNRIAGLVLDPLGRIDLWKVWVR